MLPLFTQETKNLISWECSVMSQEVNNGCLCHWWRSWCKSNAAFHCSDIEADVHTRRSIAENPQKYQNPCSGKSQSTLLGIWVGCLAISGPCLPFTSFAGFWKPLTWVQASVRGFVSIYRATGDRLGLVINIGEEFNAGKTDMKGGQREATLTFSGFVSSNLAPLSKSTIVGLHTIAGSKRPHDCILYLGDLGHDHDHQKFGDHGATSLKIDVFWHLKEDMSLQGDCRHFWRFSTYSTTFTPVITLKIILSHKFDKTFSILHDNIV